MGFDVACLGSAKVANHVPWFEDLDDFPPYVGELRMLCASGDTGRADEARILLNEMERLNAAILAGPRRLSLEEVVACYVGGEIGDRTAKFVMGWGYRRLIEECRNRDLPPVQMID